jgi:peptidyl-prolyl cis-trans isomerase D
MLRGLRKASSNWLGKAVMAAVVGFLVISFAIWGIGDIFRGFGESTVAKIGRTEITTDQFRQYYNDRLQQLGRQVGRPITAEQARAAGLDQQLLGQLIAESALDERARQLGLGVSDAEIAQRITEEPAFRGPNGQFDQQRFLALIRQAGYTERSFVNEQRRNVLRRQITSAISGEVGVPNAAAAAFNRYEAEERAIEYAVIDGSKLGPLPTPTPEQLAAYFEERKALFRAPEYRKILVLTLSPQDMARTIEVSDEDAKRAYNERLSRYSTPEKRHVHQIAFPNEEEARKAAEQLSGGLSFDQLATERKLTEKDYDLGLVAKADMLDPAVADAAFSLKEGAVSAPVTGRFSTVILRVTKIEPPQTRSFPEVEAEIKRDIALERAKVDVGARRDKVEDELAAGLHLDEVAPKLQIPVRTIDAIDRSGRGPDGQVLPDVPRAADVLTGAFGSDVGVENDVLSTPDGGFIWYEVAGITRSRDRSLDEVKDRVEVRWREDEIVKRLKAKTDELVEKLKSGTPLAEVAAANGLTIETAANIKRQANQALPAPLVAAAFETPKGGIGSSEGKETTMRVVFRVTDILMPSFDPQSEQAKRIADLLRRAYAEELLNQYVARLQSDLGTSVNNLNLAKATGRAAP